MQILQPQRKSQTSQLAMDYFSYHYSSARLYETGVDQFGFLNNILTVIYGE